MYGSPTQSAVLHFIGLYPLIEFVSAFLEKPIMDPPQMCAFSVLIKYAIVVPQRFTRCRCAAREDAKGNERVLRRVVPAVCQ